MDEKNQPLNNVLLVLLGVIMTLGVAHASPKVTYNLHTTHGSSQYENDQGEKVPFNNDNNLIGISYQYDQDSSIGIGYMEENSYYEESYILSWDNWIRLGKYADLGADLFLATGYEEVVGNPGVMPGVMPYFRVRPWGQKVASLKVGSMNFMAQVAFIEISIDF